MDFLFQQNIIKAKGWGVRISRSGALRRLCVMLAACPLSASGPEDTANHSAAAASCLELGSLPQPRSPGGRECWPQSLRDHLSFLLLPGLFFLPVSSFRTWFRNLTDFGRAECIPHHELWDHLNHGQSLHWWGLTSQINLFLCINPFKRTTRLWGSCYYYPHFPEEGTEAQRIKTPGKHHKVRKW